MRIPVLEERQVMPSGAGAPQLSVESPGGFQAIAGGVAAIGRGVDEVMASEEKARQRAVAAEVTDSETEWTRGANEDLHGSSGSGNPTGDAINEAFTGQPATQPGFLSTRGREAAAQSVATKERIAKRRKDIADNLADDEARRLFLQRTAKQLEGYYSAIEGHTSQQRQVADVATLNARKSAAIEAVRANPNNLTSVETQQLAIEGPIKALSLSPEDADADLKKWRGDVAASQIDAQLAAGDWQSAETTLKNKGALLDARNHHTLSQAVDRVRTARQSETIAADIVKQALRSDGEVNQRKALDSLERVDPELRDNVRPIALKLMIEAEQAYKADTDRITRQATAAFAKTGWTSEWAAGIGEQLRVRNPERYLALRNSVEARHRRSQLSAADARREQAARDREALNDFKSLSIEEQAQVDLDEFLAERDVSPVGRSALGPVKASAARAVQKGLAVDMDKFVRDYVAEAEPYAPKGETKKDKEARKEWDRKVKTDAVDAYTETIDAHPEKKPTLEELNAKKAERFIGYVSSPIGSKGSTDERSKAAADAIVRHVTAGAGKSPKPKMVPLIGPNGERGSAPEAGLDSWLASHPTWRRQ